MERLSPAHRSRLRKLTLLRFGFTIAALVAVFALHVSGTALVVIHVVRILVVALVVLVGGWIRTRRHRAD